MSRNAVAFEVPDSEHPDAKKAGAYYFMYRWDMSEPGNPKRTDERLGIVHACPCGCGGRGAMWFRGKSLNGSGKNAESEWDVTGEWPNVTLSPSIGFAKDRTTGQFHWHGFLRNGVFEEC